jgi:hypothetical protein
MSNERITLTRNAIKKASTMSRLFLNKKLVKNYFTLACKPEPALNFTTFFAGMLISLPV